MHVCARVPEGEYEFVQRMYEFVRVPPLPAFPKAKGKARVRVREGTSKMGALSHPDRQNGPYFT